MTLKKVLLLVLAVATMISLAACNGSDKTTQQTANTNQAEAKILDLAGNWKQSNNESADSYQTAVIQGETIEVYWVTEKNETKSLYWAGTYVAPKTADKQYSWDSANDKAKTGVAMLASSADTKTFSYSDGELSYSVSALGTTKTVKLKKE